MTFSADDAMTVAAARQLPNGAVCFVGIGLPSTAANLARRTHAPDLVLVYESGTLGSKPDRLPLSIGDGELAETADSVVSVPEVFNYWLQPGRIDIGFLSGAQIDPFGNLNSTMIGGEYQKPKVRLPGSGGANDLASFCWRTLIVMKHDAKKFVPELDFLTTPGYLTGPGGREAAGLPANTGPYRVITDLCVLDFAPESRRMRVRSLHPAKTLE